MAPPRSMVTTVSSKGQVILPVAIRKERHWDAGTRLTVEETPDGVLLKAAPLFAATHPDEVFGCLPKKGEPKSIEEMNAGVQRHVRGRNAGGRY